MNFPGRIIGGTLVAIAIAWILNIAGVFPFSSRSTNQIDSTAAPNSTAQGTGSQPLNTNSSARQGTQNLGTAQGNGGTRSTDTTVPPAPPSDGTANLGAEGTVSGQPAVRAGW